MESPLPKPLSQRDIPQDLGPRFEWKPKLGSSLSEIGGITQSIEGDGACGRYSFIEAAASLSHCHPLLRSLRDEQESKINNTLGDWNNMTKFSQIVSDWMIQNRNDLLDRNKCFFIDENGKRLNCDAFGLSTFRRDDYHVYQKKNKKVDEFEWHALRMYDGTSFPKKRSALPTYFWFSSLSHLPICCLCWGISVLFYHEENGKQMSRLLWYRDDGRVQIFKDYDGFAEPFPGIAVITHHNSYHHYESVSFRNPTGLPPTQVTAPASSTDGQSILMNPINTLLAYVYQQSQWLASHHSDLKKPADKQDLVNLSKQISAWKKRIEQDFRNIFSSSSFGTNPTTDLSTAPYVNPGFLFNNDDVVKPPSQLQIQNSLFFIMLWSSVCPVNKKSILRILICLRKSMDLNPELYSGENDVFNSLWCIHRCISGLSWFYYIDKTNQITNPPPDLTDGVELLFTGPPIRSFSIFFVCYMFSTPRLSYTLQDPRLHDTFVSQNLLHFFTISSLSYYRNLFDTNDSQQPSDSNLLSKVQFEMANLEEIPSSNTAHETLNKFQVYWIQRPIMFEHWICQYLKTESPVVNKVHDLLTEDAAALHARILEKAKTSGTDADDEPEDDCSLIDKPYKKNRFIDDEAAVALTDTPEASRHSGVNDDNNDGNNNDSLSFDPSSEDNADEVEVHTNTETHKSPIPNDDPLKHINQDGGAQTAATTNQGIPLLDLVSAVQQGSDTTSMFSFHVTPRKKSAQKLSEALSSSAKYHEQTKQNRSSSNLTSTKKSTTKQSEIESAKKYYEQKKSLSSSKSKSNNKPTTKQSEIESAKKYYEQKKSLSSSKSKSNNKPNERRNHAQKVAGTEKQATDSSPAKSTRSHLKRTAPNSRDVGDESKSAKKKPPTTLGKVSRSDQC